MGPPLQSHGDGVGGFVIGGTATATANPVPGSHDPEGDNPNPHLPHDSPPSKSPSHNPAHWVIVEESFAYNIPHHRNRAYSYNRDEASVSTYLPTNKAGVIRDGAATRSRNLTSEDVVAVFDPALGDANPRTPGRPPRGRQGAVDDLNRYRLR